MVNDTVIYAEMWPRGRLVYLRLTTQFFEISAVTPAAPQTSIPLACIRHVEISRLGFSKMLWLSYYKDANTFDTISFPISDMDAWRHAFRTVGIAVD